MKEEMSGIENDIKESDNLSSLLYPELPSVVSIKAKAISTTKKNSLSAGAIKDELIYQLSSKCIINWKTLEFTHKYIERAEFVLYRINLWNQATPPVLVINTSDLTPSLRSELEHLKSSSPRQFDKIVTESIQTLFDGINERYYHVAGLPYKVSWRFDP
jgi:hypothetical protein